jgi:hypothetical protein
LAFSSLLLAPRCSGALPAAIAMSLASKEERESNRDGIHINAFHEVTKQLKEKEKELNGSSRLLSSAPR